MNLDSTLLKTDGRGRVMVQYLETALRLVPADGKPLPLPLPLPLPPRLERVR
jgi:hypothetical protein